MSPTILYQWEKNLYKQNVESTHKSNGTDIYHWHCHENGISTLLTGQATKLVPFMIRLKKCFNLQLQSSLTTLPFSSYEFLCSISPSLLYSVTY